MTTSTAARAGARGVAGAVLLLANAGIHAELAPDHLHEVAYLGASFVVAAALLALAAVTLIAVPWSGRAWAAAGLLCLVMAIAFVASRTVGLPGVHEAWTSDHRLGVVALADELIFVGFAGHARRLSRRAGCTPVSPSGHPWLLPDDRGAGAGRLDQVQEHRLRPATLELEHDPEDGMAEIAVHGDRRRFLVERRAEQFGSRSRVVVQQLLVVTGHGVGGRAAVEPIGDVRRQARCRRGANLLSRVSS